MRNLTRMSRWLALVSLIAMTVTFNFSTHASAQAGSRYFPETNHTVTEPFLTYWNTHGALAQQGYPITDDYQEVNDADGHTYRTQYFQRSRFEYHPEQPDPQYQVLLGLLGTEAFNAKYPSGLPSGTQTQIVPGGGSYTFPDTNHTVTGLFLTYWQNHGGLAQQGFPITEAYMELNDADGNLYITQYFQRARFEYHPEQSDPQYRVLLGLVGNEIYLRKHNGGGSHPTATPVSQPTATATPAAIPVPQQVSPADGTVFTNFPRSFTLTWNPITYPGAVSYNVEIEINTGTWQNYHTQTGIAGTSYYSPNFSGDNQGRWRVWATTSAGDSAKSDWWHFSFNTAATATPTPPPSTHTVTQVFQQVTVPAGGNGHATVACPGGSYVTGGGWASNATFDVFNSSMDGNGWQVYATNNAASPQLLNAYAVCMSGLGIAPTEESTQITIGAGQHAGGSKACGASEHITGGGFAKNTGEAIYNESPDGNGWSAYAYNTTGGGLLLNIYAMCFGGIMDSTIASAQVSVPASSTAHASVACAADRLATGGGFAANDNEVVYTTDRNGNGWEAYAKNNAATSQLLNVYAVCVSLP